MTIAYFDCFSGAAGDMIVGALIDAGADPQELRDRLGGLGLSGYSLSIERVQKQGFAATRFDVRLDRDAEQPHRHLKHVREIIEKFDVSDQVRSRAIAVFTRLAEAEAKVHDTSIEKVHFHEVGAVDAIIDVVGAMLALEMLNVERVCCSPIPTGSGTVACEHGVLPIPAPATAELLRGVPLATCDEVGELTTPTGAAILTTIAQQFGPLPPMTVRSIGYGAGHREGKTRPNVLRVFIGESATGGDADTDHVVILETNLDDSSPQLIGRCMERLLAAGALDVYAVPIQMKKSRPGILLTVLCVPSARQTMESIIFSETTTFGIRRHFADRTILRRRWETVPTTYGEIRIKIGEGPHGLTIMPEFEDCRSAAEQHRVSVREVMRVAQEAWRNQ